MISAGLGWAGRAGGLEKLFTRSQGTQFSCLPFRVLIYSKEYLFIHDLDKY